MLPGFFSSLPIGGCHCCGRLPLTFLQPDPGFGPSESSDFPDKFLPAPVPLFLLGGHMVASQGR